VAKAGLSWQSAFANPRRSLASKMAFTPFEYPTSPPAGTYDPALDAQLEAAKRGYGDLTQDTEQGYQRGQTDYLTSTAEATQARDNSLADTLRARAREGTDYQTQTGLVGRKYRQIGDSQAQQAGQTGQIRGGALAGALAARTENQGIEQGAIDTQHTRFGEDSNTQEQRIHQAYDTPDTGILAKLQTAFQRSQDDAATGLSRGGRELGFYGLDTNTAKFAQAAQAGYTPPQKPSNEFSDAKGPYRLIMRGGVAYKQRPNGKLERR
jgi:hypothetical protein